MSHEILNGKRGSNSIKAAYMRIQRKRQKIIMKTKIEKLSKSNVNQKLFIRMIVTVCGQNFATFSGCTFFPKINSDHSKKESRRQQYTNNDNNNKTIQLN